MRAFTATEGSWRRAIASGDVPAGVAPLRGVPGIDPDYAPVLLPEELPVGGHGGTGDAQIDAARHSGFHPRHVREGQHDVQREPTLLLDQIRSGYRTANRVRRVVRKAKRDGDPTAGR